MEAQEAISEELLQHAIDRFWETIPMVWNKIRGNVRAIATENYEISVEQFHILRLIRRGMCSASELAEARQISRSAISQAIDLLVEKGLISRQQSTEDRRYVQLALTESGNAMLNTIFQKNRVWMMEKMTSLHPDEVSALVRGIELLKNTFAEEDK